MELRDLSVRFGDKVVFDHRDFTIPDRGVTVLTGPSGVGKTTLLKALLEAYPKDTAFLFQEDRLFPWRTVEQHLTDVMDKSRWGEAPGILKLMELEGEERSYPAVLSGGMARRLALGRCLALGGERYLLDEPFAGVDRPRAARILERLRGLGVPAILATHQPQVLAACGQIISLDGPPLKRV